MANEGASEETGEKTKPKKGKLILILLLLIAVLGGGGFAVYQFVLKEQPQETPEAAKKEPPKQTAIFPFEPFIVNLLDNQGGRFLKVVIQLEISDEKALPELTKAQPRLRDAILDLLFAKSVSDLTAPGGRQQLRDEVALRMNTHLREAKVSNVFFTEFVIQ